MRSKQNVCFILWFLCRDQLNLTETKKYEHNCFMIRFAPRADVDVTYTQLEKTGPGIKQ